MRHVGWITVCKLTHTFAPFFKRKLWINCSQDLQLCCARFTSSDPGCGDHTRVTWAPPVIKAVGRICIDSEGFWWCSKAFVNKSVQLVSLSLASLPHLNSETLECACCMRCFGSQHPVGPPRVSMWLRVYLCRWSLWLQPPGMKLMTPWIH